LNGTNKEQENSSPFYLRLFLFVRLLLLMGKYSHCFREIVQTVMLSEFAILIQKEFKNKFEEL
jgi:hypothetical protein